MKTSRIVLLVLGSLCAGLLGGGLVASRVTSPAPELPQLAGEAAQHRFGEILRLPVPADRAIALSIFLNEQAQPADAEALRGVLDEERLRVDEMVEILFAGWWARHDPHAALQRPLAAPYGGREPWGSAIFAEWARRDPRAAISAIASFQPLSARTSASRALLLAFFDTTSERDPAVLLDLFRALDEDVRARGEAIDLVLRSLLDGRGAQATIDFALAIPERPALDLRREFLGRLAGRLSLTDPDRALELIEQHAHGAYQLVMHRYFASQWGYHDGAAAVLWAAGLPRQTEGREGTLLRAWRSWVKRDRRSAHAWMRAQDPSAGLEPAYARFVAAVARQDPEEGLRLLDNVRDGAARRTILTNVGIALYQRDPGSGRAWMESETLPEEVRATILDRAAKLGELGRKPGIEEPG